MHQILTEAAVRQLRFKKGQTTIYAEPGAYITKEAREYIRAMRMTLIEQDAVPRHAKSSAARTDVKKVPENTEIRPLRHAPGKPKFTNAVTGETYDEKPEQMTHLRGVSLVPKTHPAIRLRGQLDTLEAHIIQYAVKAREEGRALLVEDLAECLAYARAILGCEVTEKPFGVEKLLGMDEARLRRVSQYPKEELGHGHILPTVELSWVAAALNALRAEVRQVELAAADAFFKEDGSCERIDLIRALNRMSSAFYIMMFYELEGRYERGASRGKGRPE